jgi:hypothetical protein
MTIDIPTHTAIEIGSPPETPLTSLEVLRRWCDDLRHQAFQRELAGCRLAGACIGLIDPIIPCTDEYIVRRLREIVQRYNDEIAVIGASEEP